MSASPAIAPVAMSPALVEANAMTAASGSGMTMSPPSNLLPGVKMSTSFMKLALQQNVFPVLPLLGVLAGIGAAAYLLKSGSQTRAQRNHQRSQSSSVGL